MMSAYSAVSHGHAHPRIVARAGRAGAAARGHVARVLQRTAAAPARAAGRADRARPRAAGQRAALEAVETALKAARKWGHKVKGMPDERAEIIVVQGQLPRPLDHDRRLLVRAAVSRRLRAVPAGLPAIPYGDPDALERAIGPHTAAFLVEPIQGEARHRRAAGRLSRALRAHLPRAQRVLLICDEMQTGHRPHRHAFALRSTRA